MLLNNSNNCADSANDSDDEEKDNRAADQYKQKPSDDSVETSTKKNEDSKWEAVSVVRISAYDDKLENLQKKRQESGVVYGKPYSSTEVQGWQHGQQGHGQIQYDHASGKSQEVLAYPGSEKKTTYTSSTGTITDYKAKTNQGNYWNLEINPNPPEPHQYNKPPPYLASNERYSTNNEPRTHGYGARPEPPAPTYQNQHKAMASEEIYYNKAVGYANTKISSELDHFVQKHKIKFEEDDKSYSQKVDMDSGEQKTQGADEETGQSKEKINAVMAMMSSDSKGSGETSLIYNE